MSADSDSAVTQRALPFGPSSQDDGDTINLGDLFGMLLAGWLYIAGAALLAVLLALYYLFVTPPGYVTDALVQVENNQGARLAFGAMAEGIGDIPTSAEIEILRSRFVMGKVVDRLQLDTVVAPAYFPYVGEAFARRHSGSGLGQAPFWLRPFADETHTWGGEQIVVSTLEVPEALRGSRFRLVAQADERFVLLGAEGRELLTGRVGEMATASLAAGELRIFVRELVARPGAEFQVQKLRRDAAIRRLQAQFGATAQRETGMLVLTYSGNDRQEIARILTEILAIYQAQNVERRSAEAEKTLAFVEQQLPRLRGEVEAAEARLNHFMIEQGTADLDRETAAVLQRSLELEQAKVELQQRRDEALLRFTANHPVVQAIDSQVAQIDEQLRTVAERIRELPDIQQKTLELTRDAQLHATLYISLLNRSQELEVVRSGTVGNIRVIDYPIVPFSPSSPKKGLTLALSLMLGLMAGMGFVLVRRAMHTAVDDPSEVERQLGIPTYAAIPWSETQQRLERFNRRKPGGAANHILAQINPEDPASEALRSLRTSLHFAMLEARNNVLMLTGPSPGLGKSFVSINLGAMLALGGKRVVVVDADMRRGHLHEYIGAERARGLSDVIAGELSLDEALHATPVEGLSLLTTGMIPPNPAELVMNARFAQLVEELSAKYDHVLIDTPPVLAVTDAAEIGRLAGCSLLLLKAGEHPMRAIEETVKRLRVAGIEVRGTIFNQMGRNRGAYGYGYGYGYQYGYTYGYKSVKEP